MIVPVIPEVTLIVPAPITISENEAVAKMRAASAEYWGLLTGSSAPRHVLMDHHGTELDPTEIEETKRIWRRADAAFIPKTEGACGEKKPLPAQARNPKGQYGLYCI